MRFIILSVTRRGPGVGSGRWPGPRKPVDTPGDLGTISNTKAPANTKDSYFILTVTPASRLVAAITQPRGAARAAASSGTDSGSADAGVPTAPSRSPGTAAEVRIRHRCPGRVRLRVDALRDWPGLADRLGALLACQPGVRRVRANPSNGSLIVHYGDELSAEGVRADLAAHLAAHLAAPAVRTGLLPASPATATHRVRQGVFHARRRPRATWPLADLARPVPPPRGADSPRRRSPAGGVPRRPARAACWLCRLALRLARWVLRTALRCRRVAALESAP